MTFYTYVMRDPRPGKNLQPIYVGKGKGRRVHVHWRKALDHRNPLLRRVFGKLHKSGLEPQIEIVGHFDVETEAFQREIELIAQYGRRDLGLGTLCNLTDGGDGASGCLITATRVERFRKQLTDPESEFSKARVEGLRKPEVRKANSERMRKRSADPEFRKANSDRTRKQNADPEFIKARAEALVKLHADPEFTKANTERMRKRSADPEFKTRAAAGRAAYQAKGLSCGEGNSMAKLNEEAVCEIKKRIASGERSTPIGCDFGVSRRTISHIKNGTTWGHVNV